mgnify:CR=1 FL=1
MPTLHEWMNEHLSGKESPAFVIVMLREAASSLENLEIGRQILQISGAEEHCRQICNTKGWDFQEFSILGVGADRGAFLMAKSPGGGSVDQYYGQMILVGADALARTIVVYSLAQPFITSAGPKGGWDRNGIRQAITRAFNVPGSYEWCEGMASERLIYRQF